MSIQKKMTPTQKKNAKDMREKLKPAPAKLRSGSFKIPKKKK